MKRDAILLLHRKIDGQSKCVCGSKMEFIDGEFVCLKQIKLKEPSKIKITIRDVMVKEHRNDIIIGKIK